MVIVTCTSQSLVERANLVLSNHASFNKDFGNRNYLVELGDFNQIEGLDDEGYTAQKIFDEIFCAQ